MRAATRSLIGKDSLHIYLSSFATPLCFRPRQAQPLRLLGWRRWIRNEPTQTSFWNPGHWKKVERQGFESDALPEVRRHAVTAPEVLRFRLFGAPSFAQQIIILSRVMAFQAIKCVIRRLDGGNTNLLFDYGDVLRGLF